MMTNIHTQERRGGKYLRRNRSDGRLKRYNSCEDGRAWSQDRCERHNYLMDYIASSYDSPPKDDSHWGEHVPVPVLVDVIVEPYKSEIQMLQLKLNNLQNKIHECEEGMSGLKRKEEDIVSDGGIVLKSMVSNFEGTKNQELYLKEQENDFDGKESNFEEQQKSIYEQEKYTKENYDQEKENFDKATSSDQIKKIRSTLKEINSDFDALMFSNENEINSLKSGLIPPVGQAQRVYATTIEATPICKRSFRDKEYNENLKHCQEDVERKSKEVQDLLENLRSQLLEEENYKNEMISQRISRKSQAKRMKWQNKIQETEKGIAGRDESVDNQEYSSLKGKIDILSKRVSFIEKSREKMDQENYKEAGESDNREYLSKIKDLEDKIKKLEEEIEKKKNTTNELTTQLKIYSEKLDQFTGGFEGQEEGLSQMKEQLKCCELEKKEIEEKVKKLESQIMFAKENKEKSVSEIKEMRESETQTLDDELAKQIESLLSELERAETQLTHKTNTIESLNEIISLTESRLHDRETELSEIEDRYQKLLEEYQELQLTQQRYEESLGSEKAVEKPFFIPHEIVVEPIKEVKESKDMEEIFTVSDEEAVKAEALEEPEKKEATESAEDGEVEKDGFETEAEKGKISVEDPGEVMGVIKDEDESWDGKEVAESAKITEVKLEEIESDAGKSTIALEEPDVNPEKIESMNNKSEVFEEKPETDMGVEKELVVPEIDKGEVPIEKTTVTAEEEEGEVNSNTEAKELIIEDSKTITKTEPEVIDPMARNCESFIEEAVTQIEKEDEPIADKGEVLVLKPVMVKDLENEEVEPVVGKNEVHMEEPMERKERNEDEAEVIKSDIRENEPEVVTLTEQEEIESETVINEHLKKEAEETEEKEQEKVGSDIGKNEVPTEESEPVTEVEEVEPEARKIETSTEEPEMISEVMQEETNPELEKIEVHIDEPEKITNTEEAKPEAGKNETLLDEPETIAENEPGEVEANAENGEIFVESPGTIRGEEKSIEMSVKTPDTIKGEGQNIESENEKSEIPVENPEIVAKMIPDKRQEEVQAESEISEIPPEASEELTDTTETVQRVMAEDIVKLEEPYISGGVSNIPNGDKEEIQVEKENIESIELEAKESELKVEKCDVDPERGEVPTGELEVSDSPEAVSDTDDHRQKEELNAEDKKIEALTDESEKLEITDEATDAVGVKQNKTKPDIIKEEEVQAESEISEIPPEASEELTDTTETVQGEMAEDVVKLEESYISGGVSNIPNGDKEEIQVEKENIESIELEAKESELKVEKCDVHSERGEIPTGELEVSDSPVAVSDIDDHRQKEELNAEGKKIEVLTDESKKLEITDEVTDAVGVKQNKTKPDIIKEENVEPKEQYSGVSPKEDRCKNKQSVSTEPRVSITPKKSIKTKKTALNKPSSATKAGESTLKQSKNVVKPKETKVSRESNGRDSLRKAKLSITKPTPSQRGHESQTALKEKPDDVGKVSVEDKSTDTESLHQEKKQDETKATNLEPRGTEEVLRLSLLTCKEDKGVQTTDIPETSQKPQSLEEFDLLKMENEQLKERVANLENEKATNLMTIDSLQQKIDKLKAQQFSASEPTDMKDNETETDPDFFEADDTWIQKQIDEISYKISKTQEILECYKLIDQEANDREVKLLEEVENLKNIIKELGEKETNIPQSTMPESEIMKDPTTELKVENLKNIIKELGEKETNIPQSTMPESEIIKDPTTELKGSHKKFIVTDIVYYKKLQKHSEIVHRLQEHYRKSCSCKDVSSQRKSSSLRTYDSQHKQQYPLSQPLTSKSTKTQQSLVETKNKYKLQEYCSINCVLYKYNGDQTVPRKEVGTCKEKSKIDVKYRNKDKTKIMMTMF